MATYYLDYEGGSDAADGTTFANRWKTFTSGATAARTAPGDTIRVMGSPAATSLGINGTWTDCPAYGPELTVAITSSTNASPIAITTTTNHNLSTGNYVYITGHTTNTAANGLWKITVSSGTVFTLTGSTGNGVGGATGTVQNYTSCVVELASAVTKTITSTGNAGSGRTGWTASANVTCTQGTTFLKSGNVNDNIAVAAGFTTGLAAYKALGAATDFSAYKQVSFWIRQSSGTVSSASDISIKLCSDTVGATAVNTVNVPAFGALNAPMRVTIDTGGTLGASIQSVGFYVNVDRGAQTFQIDNIIACKDSTSADSLSLRSLIGKNTGTETWYNISFINDTMVVIDNTNSSSVATIKGYTGTTETITTYKREVIMLPSVAFPTTVSGLGTVQEAGTAGSVITYSGGWDRTAMTTQNLESWFSIQNGYGVGITCGVNYITIDKINFAGVGKGYSSSGQFNTLSNFHVNGCGLSAIDIDGAYSTITNMYASNNHDNVGLQVTGTFFYANAIYAANNGYSSNSVGIYLGGGSFIIDSIGSASNNVINIQIAGSNGIIKSITNANNSTNYTTAGSFSISGSNNTIYNCGNVQNNRLYGFIMRGNNCKIYNATMSGNSTADVGVGSGINIFRNCSFGSTTEQAQWLSYSLDAAFFSEKHDQTANNHYFYSGYATMLTDASVRHTASGISWKMSPTQLYVTATNPLKLSIAKIACTASNLVTVKAWMRRSNTGLTMTLACPGGQLNGVSSDVTSSMTAAADTWEELTITFTPTEAGVVEIFAYASGGTTYNGYVDDITITQA